MPSRTSECLIGIMTHFGLFRICPSSRAREDGHILKNPKWVIIPIKHSEVRDGIWHEDPF